MKIGIMTIVLLVLATSCSSGQDDSTYSIPEHSSIREIIIPEKDVFSGKEVLELSGISLENIEAIAFHLSEDIDDQNIEADIMVTDRKDIDKVYQLFFDTEIAVDIMGSPPDTGEQLDMYWYFDDGTQLTFNLRGYLRIEGHDSPYGTYVFTGGKSQSDYIELFRSFINADSKE